jgi:HIP---CoA ligase
VGSGHGTIPAALRRAAERFGDREAIVDRDVRLTYAQLHRSVRECARFFVASGVGEGERVAIWSPNTHHWVRAALGALCAGATLVPINTRFTGSEALDIVRRSGAGALVVADHFLGTDRLTELRSAAAQELPPNSGTGQDPVPGLPDLHTVLRVPVEDADRNRHAEHAVTEWHDLPTVARRVGDTALDDRLARIDQDAPSDILFTSGTTGRSKGALTSHARSLGVAQAWAEIGGLTERDRYLVVNPFFHSFGYKAGILAALLAGATLLPQRTFDVTAMFELIESERVTVLPGAPTIYQVMLDDKQRADYDLSSLRLAVTGAAMIPVVLIERMRAELTFDRVLTAYGLTEAVVATMCRASDSPETIARTSGRAAAGFDVKTVAPDGTSVAAGEQGEVVLRGPNVMLGYLDDPAATAQAIDADGWLHTGDVGVLDELGYLTITDRIKDMYVSGGFNAYPAEVEQAIARLDGVAESAVVGIPDDRLGEVGKAFIVGKPGHRLSESDVIEHCRTLLANYKVPRAVTFVAALPRNATGKVLKRTLRDGEEAR